MNNVEKYFASKRSYAESQIGDDSPVIAMSYRAINKDRKSETRVYLATKIKYEVDKIQPLGLSVDEDPIFLIAGSGNYAEFDGLATASEEYVSRFLSTMGGRETLSAGGLIEELSQGMRDKFIDGKKAYDVEILITSFYDGPLEIFWIKYDGTPHPCKNFGFVGGYGKNSNSGESRRAEIFNKLTAVYKTGRLPGIKTVKKVVREMLGPDTDREYLIQTSFAPLPKKD